jgi:hypothetical protein
MPTQEDIDWNNIVSKNQRAETRRERQVEKDVKDRRKSLLRGASSTKERRAIKAGVYDLNTRPDDNKEGTDERIQNDGIDRITSPIQDNSGSDDSNGGGSVELYAFKIIDDGDGTVSVTTGTVNTETATGLTPSGKPTELWLKVTFDTDGEVTAASVQASSGSTSETQDYRQIATITWSGDSPTIVQGIKGSQSIASCGATHQWGTLYS